MKISSCSKQIFTEENLISYKLPYCYFTPITITRAYEKKPVSTWNNFIAVFFIKSFMRKISYLVFRTNNSHFFQGPIANKNNTFDQLKIGIDLAIIKFSIKPFPYEFSIKPLPYPFPQGFINIRGHGNKVVSQFL